jgi:hypothetical protein
MAQTRLHPCLNNIMSDTTLHIVCFTLFAKKNQENKKNRYALVDKIKDGNSFIEAVQQVVKEKGVKVSEWGLCTVSSSSRSFGLSAGADA